LAANGSFESEYSAIASEPLRQYLGAMIESILSSVWVRASVLCLAISPAAAGACKITQVGELPVNNGRPSNAGSEKMLRITVSRSGI